MPNTVMETPLRTSGLLVFALAAILVGCGSPAGNGGGTGGETATGGTRGSGGVEAQGSGGMATGSGGTTGSGGVPVGSGGVASSGGVTNSGGATGSGGMIGAAGAKGSGGRANGGAKGSGGTTGAAGTKGSGGASTGNGGAGACTPDYGCKPTAPSTGDYYADCVTRVNQFRACVCLPPLARWNEGESCADMDAAYDPANGAHAGFIADICSPEGNAQDECPGYSSETQVIGLCIQQMFDEGPPPTADCTGDCYEMHGHFINMTNTRYKKIACGIATVNGKVTAVQDLQ